MARISGIHIIDQVKNYIINGNFDFWQRGTSFTNTGGYNSDRWRFGGTLSGNTILSQQAFTLGQTEVPNEPSFYFRWDQTVATTGATMDIEHRVEGVKTLAGKNATLTFWARLNSGAGPFTLTATQNFGTGGSPSSPVVALTTTFTPTSLWQKFTFVIPFASLTGKTIGTNADSFVRLQFIMPSTGTWQLDLAQMMLNDGTVAAPWSYASGGTALNVQGELALCQRYYEKNYDTTTAPALGTSVGALAAYQGANSNLSIYFKVPKRAAPTVTFYSISTGTSGVVRNIDANADHAASASIIGQNAVIYQVSTATTGQLLRVAFTADSEL